MNTYTLTISKMINGGFGLGQLPDGRFAMVSGVLPGERITMGALQEKRKYVTGKALSIVEASPERITPACPYYEKCGGCDLQHATYTEQLRIKRDIFLNLLSREQALPESAISCSVEPTLGSPAQTGYRQRIRLFVNDACELGFRQKQSHDITPITQCLIARPELNTLLELLPDHPQFNKLLAHTQEIELLHNPANDQVTLLAHFSRKPRPTDLKLAKELTSNIGILERLFFIGEGYPLVQASPDTEDKLFRTTLPSLVPNTNPLSIGWEVGGFCQVNLEQNVQMVKLASTLAGVTKEDTVLDLFCGAGNFSLPLAQQANSLLGIEGQGSAIRSAKTNGSANNLTNCTFIKQPIEKGVGELIKEGRQFDCVILDPPRLGIPGMGQHIAQLCTKRLVYISCDPATLTRDLADLTTNGFAIRHIQPVDMFPQTHHIEMVVLLEKH